MKTKLRKFGAGLMALALAFAGAGAYGETKTLDVSGIAAGGVLEISEAGTYKFPNLPNNITLKATVEGVVFDCNGSGSIASVPNGAKLEGLSFVFGSSSYHGWHGAGKMEFSDCAFEGLFFSYGDMIFNDCTFRSPGTEYCMWCYAGNVTYKGCTVNCQGKFANVYNEHNGSWKIVAEGCTFNSTKVNKAALNVKSTCGTGLKFDVTVSDCKVNENFPTASTSASLIVFNGVVQLDDIKAGAPDEITITVDGRVVYKDNAAIPEPITVTVEKNDEKGVTQDVVTEIAGNKEVGKLEETGLKEALPAEELEKGEPVIKVQLKEVAENTLKFDVTPYVGAEEVKALNGNPVAVRLPLVEAKFDGEYAKVIHEGDPIRFVLVKKGATGSYVDLTLTHFSEIDVLLAQSEELVHAIDADAVEIQPGLWGANGKASIADAEIVYIVGKTGLEAFRDWANARTGLDGKVFGAGKTFILVADVDLQGGDANLWTPIGTGDHDNLFSGTFDGNGRSIQNLCVKFNGDAGLFNEITKDGCIKDLTVASGRIATTAGNGGVGAVAGYMTGGRIENVINRAEIQAIGTYGRLGGVVGIQGDKDYGDVSVISNCVNYGKVWQDSGLATAGAGGHLGGIVGQCAYMLKVLSCENYGDVTADLATINVGGIIGNGKCQKNTGFPEEVLTVENCVNYGAVTTAGGGNIAGVICKFENGKQGHGTATKIGAIFGNCANYGELIGNPSLSGAGGGFVEMQWGASKVKLSGPVTVRKGQTFSNYSLASSVWDPQPVATCPSVAKDIDGDDIDVIAYYLSIAEAVAAAKAGDTVTLVSASSENFTLKVGVTFDASKAAYSGTISAPEGYFVKEVSTKVYECQPAVAQIGEKIYSSLQEALAAVQKDETVNLLATAEDPEVKDFHTAFTLDLNGFTLNLTGSYAACADIKVCNGTIDITDATGGMWVDNQWYWVFHVNPGCTFSFEGVELKGAPAAGCSYPFQTAANCDNAVFAFKDCKIVDVKRSNMIFANNLSKMTFDHCELVFTDVTGVFKNDNGGPCGLLEFTNGSTLTVTNTGRSAAVFNRQYRLLIDNSIVDVKNYGHIVSQQSNVELANGGKFHVDGAKSHGITGTHDAPGDGMVLVVGSGCELSVSNCANVGINVCGIGSVFKSGSKVSAGGNCRPIPVVVDGMETTWNPAAATYNGTEVDLRVHADDLTIEKGAAVDIAGYCCVMSAGAATIADGRFKNVKTWNNTAENLVTVSLAGGIYKEEPSPAFVNPAYEKVANTNEATKADYPWAIAAKPGIVEVYAAADDQEPSGTTYSLELAFKTVPTGGKIVLTADCDESFTVDRDDTFKFVIADGVDYDVAKITLPAGYGLNKGADGSYCFIKDFYQDAEDANLWHVASAAGLKEFRDKVNARTSFANKTISIDADCDLTGEEWTPIEAYDNGYALTGSTILGNNHKIIGMSVNVPAKDSGYYYGAGFISKTATDITIKDLTFQGATVNSPSGSQVGVVLGMTYGTTKLENVDLVDCSVTGMTKTGAYIGQNDEGNPNVSFKDCDLVNTKAYANYSAALFIGLCNVNNMGFQFENCTADKDSKFVWIEGESEKGDVSLYGCTFCVDGGELWLTDPGEGCWAERRVDGATETIGGVTYRVYGSEFYPPYIPEVDVKDEVEEPVVTDAAGQEITDQDKLNEAKEVAQQVKTEVTDTLNDAEIAKAEGTGVAQAATETKTVGEEQVVVVKDGVVAALKKEATENVGVAHDVADEQIKADSKVESHVEIVFNALEVKVDTSSEVAAAKETTITYEVTPKVKTTVTVAGQEPKVVETIIPNEVLQGNPIAFRLALDSTFGDGFVRVLHTWQGESGEKSENYLASIIRAGDKRLVELSSENFSPFKLTKTDEVAVCKVGAQSFATIADAIAASVDDYGTTIELIADINPDVVVDGLGKRVIARNGKAFLLSQVTPVGDDEVVSGKGGKVYTAAKKVEVPTGDHTVMPIRGYVASTDDPASELAGDSTTGNKVWQDYALFGNNEGAYVKLTPQIVKAEPGFSKVVIKAAGDYVLDKPVRSGVAVSFQLLKRDGTTGNFAEVGEASATPGFTVDVKEIGPKTYWKIQTVFSCEEEQ